MRALLPTVDFPLLPYVTVLLFICFVMMVVAVWNRSNDKQFERAANLPLKDEDK